MSYLLIKENDAKIFKAFLSGRQIEVGVVVPAKSDMFIPGEEIEIFYGEHADTYQAKVVSQKKLERRLSNEDQSFVMVGLQRR